MDDFENRKYIEDYSIYKNEYYPNTKVMINKLNIQDQDKLEEYERVVTSLALLEMKNQIIATDFDYKHLLGIHQKLFEEIYDFAGKMRNVDLIKEKTFFCRKEYVLENLNETLKSMKQELYRVDSEEKYIHILSKYYLDLNFIHPFREGNGRTLREFFRQYVESLNDRIDFGNYEFKISRFDKENLIKHTKDDNLEGIKEEMKKALMQKEVKYEQERAKSK